MFNPGNLQLHYSSSSMRIAGVRSGSSWEQMVVLHLKIVNNSNELVVVNFFVEWHMSCLMLSPVIDKGNINIGNLVPIDYNGNLRTSDIAPDLGAFERVP
jgi:hypothetical protein